MRVHHLSGELTRSLPLSVLTSSWQSGKDRRVVRNQGMNLKVARAAYPSRIVHCPNDHAQVVFPGEADRALRADQVMQEDFVCAALNRRVDHSPLTGKPGHLSFRLEQSAGTYRRINSFYLRDQIEVETDNDDSFTELVLIDQLHD